MPRTCIFALPMFSNQPRPLFCPESHYLQLRPGVLQLLGFNCLRVPFSFQNLFYLTPTDFTKTCTAATTADIQAAVTDPTVPVPAGDTIPAQVQPCLFNQVALPPHTTHAYAHPLVPSLLAPAPSAVSTLARLRLCCP